MLVKTRAFTYRHVIGRERKEKLWLAKNALRGRVHGSKAFLGVSRKQSRDVFLEKTKGFKLLKSGEKEFK